MGSGRGQTQNFSSTGSIGSKSCDPQPSFERLPKSKMGSGRVQTQNFSSTGSIGSKSCDPNPPLSASQNQKWAPGEAKTKTVGPLERMVLIKNAFLRASYGAHGVGEEDK